MKKTEVIESYLSRCDDVLTRKDVKAAKELILEIRSVFSSEIPAFLLGLDCNSFFTWGSASVDWLKDITLVKGKLLNHAASFEIKESSKKPSTSSPINVYNTAIAVASNDIDIEVMINEAKNNITESTSLSESDTKVALEKMDELLSIAKAKETKKGKWFKIGAIFKWIADKSVDLAIAFVPTLLKVLDCLH